MFDNDGKLDERSQRILAEQTIPPRYGRSPGDIDLSQDDKSFRFTVSFTRRSEPEGEIITETCGDSKTEYGPMLSDIVPAFIEERRTFWKKLAETQLTRFHTDFACFGNAKIVWPPNASSVE